MPHTSARFLASSAVGGVRAACLLLAGLILCAPDRAWGQSCTWSLPGTHIATDPATCKVGIGLTPNFPLTVGGANPQVRLFSSGSKNLYLGAEWLNGVPTIGTNNDLALSLATNNTPRLFIDGQGRVGIGTGAQALNDRLEVVGNVRVVGNAVFTGTVTGANVTAHYQDIAEWVPSRETLEPGVVVVLDRRAVNHVVASTSPYDTAVAGVVSATPGVLLGAEATGRVKVATTGRVKVHVDATRAPVAVGDLLVTGEKPGVAMRSEPIAVAGITIHRPGTVIGKALEPLAGGTGEILVLLSLQ